MVAEVGSDGQTAILNPFWSLFQRFGAVGTSFEMKMWASGACLPKILAMLDRIDPVTTTHRPGGGVIVARGVRLECIGHGRILD